MPILAHSSRRSWSHRLMVAVIYVSLSTLGVTMVIPFMMTVSSSLANNYDFQQYRPIPRYLYSHTDRFTKGLAGYFNIYTDWTSQFAAYFPDVPGTWTGWFRIGSDTEHADDLARKYVEATPPEQEHMKTMARDYADFAENYPLEDCMTAADPSLLTDYLPAHLETEWEARWAAAHPTEAAHASAAQRRAAALQLMGDLLEIPYNDFRQVNFKLEMEAPRWQQSWIPPNTARYQGFLDLERAFKNLQFTPGASGLWTAYLRHHHVTSKISFPIPENAPADQRTLWLGFKREMAPASPAIPYALRTLWRKFLLSEKVEDMLHIGLADQFDIAHYNALAGTLYLKWSQIPFPPPADAPGPLQHLWTYFVENYYPVRLTTMTITPDLTAQYQQFLQKQFKGVPQLNQLLGTSYAQWTDFHLAPDLSQAGKQKTVWVDFVKQLPAATRTLHSSEADFQHFILARYGNLAGLNKAWGTNYQHIEEVFPPFDMAYAITFAHTEWPMTLAPALNNYEVVFTYLFRQSNALYVTLLLIAISIFCTLTVNPFAAYALSRFNLRGQQSILLFMLATSAFPAMVSAIPGYLLMRDLGMLNTFWALVLPGAASGMSIFILKGFFDSLPPELFEAATIDGAKEWQIFLHVTMPMVKPILAIQILASFMAAFTGWSWALIVCQDPRMWTLAVWMYQFSVTQPYTYTPWIVNAGFIIMSIPTLIVFLTCQNVILRGIILPQMK